MSLIYQPNWVEHSCTFNEPNFKINFHYISRKFLQQMNVQNSFEVNIGNILRSNVNEVDSLHRFKLTNFSTFEILKNPRFLDRHIDVVSAVFPR